MDEKQYYKVKKILDEKERLYNNPSFVEKDPISVPHSFSLKQDIEIMGFFASVFAWGQRPTIIKKCRELSEYMDGNPFQFITQHRDEDLKVMLNFKHRTFNATDLLYFIDFLKRHYAKFDSLEDAFVPKDEKYPTVEKALINFYNYFFEGADPKFRTRKHISTPDKKSACKRLNMFLRWMVRSNANGVDFGLWNRLQPKDLICPLDLHVERTARLLGLITRKNPDWLAAIELTDNLRKLDPYDPVKYDFALFGMSIEEGLKLKLG